jgi:hypothetical protein
MSYRLYILQQSYQSYYIITRTKIILYIMVYELKKLKKIKRLKIFKKKDIASQ